jgi:argininosuccinate lyase
MAKKMWGGRFKKKIDPDFDKFQKSIHYDYNLAKYDIYHSKIHVEALEGAGILSRKEARKIFSALNKILDDINKGRFFIDADSEDIHTDIQNKVEEKIGETAFKLHTLRSRNDQIVFDEKWYCYAEGLKILGLLNGCLNSFGEWRKDNKNSFIIGYTHCRRAQVVAFRDYVNAFYSMLARDTARMAMYLEELFISVGSGALAGSSISKESYDKSIKSFLNEFREESRSYRLAPIGNTLDAVSSRDFIVEFLSIISIIQMHLSRMAEDFILYSTCEYDFFDLPEEFCTGSSLMPHKKNPDFLELVRGYTGRINGNLVSVLTTMKGLPLTYNRDMQLDKEPLFSSTEIIREELKVMAKFVKGIKLNQERLAEVLTDESLYATEIAEYLVHQKVPFTLAHDIVGKLIRYSEDKSVKVKDIPNNVLKNFHKSLNRDEIKKIMSPRYAVSSKKSISRKLPQSKRVRPRKNR